MSSFYRGVTLGIIISVTGLVTSFIFAAFHLDERWDLSLLFNLRETHPVPSDVIIVSIDENSAHTLDVPEDPREWPRSYHARLIDILSSEGASVIAFDLFFNKSRSVEDDYILANSMDRAGNVVLSEYLKKVKVRDAKGGIAPQLHTEKHIQPIPSLAQAAVSVASFPLPHDSSQVNQYWTFKQGAGNIPTLPVVVFTVFSLDSYDQFIKLLKKHSALQLDSIPENRQELVSAGNINIVIQKIRNIFLQERNIARKMLNDIQDATPRTRQLLRSLIHMFGGSGSQYLNFYGPPRTIPTIPYYRILQLQESQQEFDVLGKAVFVGVSETMWSEKQKDGHYTVYSQAGGLDISGVEIAATAFSNILEEMPVRPLSPVKQLSLIFLWGLVLGILFENLLPPVLSVKEIVLPAIIALFMGSGYLFIVLHQFNASGVWYPVVVPLLQIPLSFFGSTMCAHICGERTGYGIYLFTDIKDFARFSEGRDPGVLKKIMSNYYRPITKVVEHYCGVMESVPGDAMLARWEVKKSDSTLIKRKEQACLAALEIKKESGEFILSTKERLHTRIGVHFGRASRGRIGSRHQRTISTFGDTVNTAQRIEELNKDLGTEILVSEAVLTSTNGFMVREVGKFIMTGKSVPVLLYELIGSTKDSIVKQRDLCTHFSEALDTFRKRSWDDAEHKFSDLIKHYGTDGPSIYYLRLCEEYRRSPPDRSWEGEIILNNH